MTIYKVGPEGIWLTSEPWWSSSRDKTGNGDCQQEDRDEQHCNNQLTMSGKIKNKEV